MMIDLQRIVSNEKNRIVQVNQVPLEGRVVNGITIMDSGSADGWAKTGELVITSSKMMPENIDDAKQLIRELVDRKISCLMVKPYTHDKAAEFPHAIIDFGDELNLPLFAIKDHVTSIQVLNSINAQLLEGRRIGKMADLDLDYLLKSNSASEKDFVFISELKGMNLFDLNIRLVKISFAQAPQPNERLSVQLDLVNQIHEFFSHAQRENRIMTYFILEATNGATVISFFNHAQTELPPNDRTRFTTLFKNVNITRFTVFEGVSGMHPAKKIHRAFSEASFGVEVAKTLGWSERPVFYRDVSLWDLVNKISKAQDSRLYPVEMDEILEDPEIYETIKEFFNQNESIKETSETLYTHPNTIRYRLTQIYKQTGLDYRRTNDKFLIYIALIKKMMKNAK